MNSEIVVINKEINKDTNNYLKNALKAHGWNAKSCLNDNGLHTHTHTHHAFTHTIHRDHVQYNKTFICEQKQLWV